MTQRYAMLQLMVAQHKPESIIEIGVGEGRTAEMMIRQALQHRKRVMYCGYDLFEDATAENDDLELNAKRHTSMDEIVAKLSAIQAEHPGFDFILKKGNTRDQTHGHTADFAFIDGGHSVETIANDFDIVRGSKVVVFDDYYGKDDQGRGPDTTQFGANQLADELGAIILGKGDPVKDGGLVHLAVFPAEAAPKQKLKIASRNCAPDEEIQTNVESAILRGLPFVEQCRVHDLVGVMCSGGPSLVDTLDDIRKYSSSSARIVCVKHSHDVLIDAGIIPWACMLLDPRDHVRDFIENPHPEVTYFVGSMVHPTTLDRLIEKKAKVRLYHAHVGAGEERVVRMANHFTIREHNRIRKILDNALEDGDAKATLFRAIDIPRRAFSDKLVAGGTTSAMRGVNVLWMLGFRRFHLYAYDSCFREEPDLTEKTAAGEQKNYSVTVAGRKFWTDGELLCQYQDLQSLLKGLPEIEIEVFGDGLFQHGFKHLERLPVLEEVLA